MLALHALHARVTQAVSRVNFAYQSCQILDSPAPTRLLCFATCRRIGAVLVFSIVPPSRQDSVLPSTQIFSMKSSAADHFGPSPAAPPALLKFSCQSNCAPSYARGKFRGMHASFIVCTWCSESDDFQCDARFSWDCPARLHRDHALKSLVGQCVVRYSVARGASELRVWVRERPTLATGATSSFASLRTLCKLQLLGLPFFLISSTPQPIALASVGCKPRLYDTATPRPKSAQYQTPLHARADCSVVLQQIALMLEFTFRASSSIFLVLISS